MLARSFQLYRNSFSGLSKDVWLLALVTFINRSGTMVIPFLTIYLTQQLNFTFVQAGWAMSCWGFGSLSGSYIGGRLTDRFGYYNLMFWTLLANGGMFFLLMNMTSFWSFCLMVFLLTTIGDAFRPAMMASLGAYSRPENYTRSLSLIRMAVNLGFAAGPAVGGFLAVTLGYDWLFMVDGFTCIGAAFLFRNLLSEKPDLQKHTDPKATNATNGSAYKDGLYLFFLALMLLNMIAFMQLFSTVPLFFKQQFLLNEGQVGGLMAINGLLIALFEMPMIYLLENRFAKMMLISLGAGLVGFSYLAFNMSLWVGVLGISIILVTFGEIISFPFSNAFALGRSAAHNRGQFMGLYSMMFATAFIIAPSLGMWLVQQFGYAALWYWMAGLSGLAGVGFLFLWKRNSIFRYFRARRSVA